MPPAPSSVTVTNPDGQAATLANGITPIWARRRPSRGVTPTSGAAAGGTALTITGTNFVAGATVTIGGTAATAVSVVNSTTITATTPAHAAGAVSVTVTNPDAQAATFANAFTYVSAAPTISGVTPTSGASTGGTVADDHRHQLRHRRHRHRRRHRGHRGQRRQQHHDHRDHPGARRRGRECDRHQSRRPGDDPRQRLHLCQCGADHHHRRASLRVDRRRHRADDHRHQLRHRRHRHRRRHRRHGRHASSTAPRSPRPAPRTRPAP